MPYSGFQPLPSMRTPPLARSARRVAAASLPPGGRRSRRTAGARSRGPEMNKGGGPAGSPPLGARKRGEALRAAHRIPAVEALVTGSVAHGDVAAGVAERSVPREPAEQLILCARRTSRPVRRARSL